MRLQRLHRPLQARRKITRWKRCKFRNHKVKLLVPKAERLFRIMSQKAVAAWQRRLVRNHVMTAEERYQHFITTYPDIAAMLTNKLIASYLGITQEFVSVIRKRRSLKKN